MVGVLCFQGGKQAAPIVDDAVSLFHRLSDKVVSLTKATVFPAAISLVEVAAGILCGDSSITSSRHSMRSFSGQSILGSVQLIGQVESVVIVPCSTDGRDTLLHVSDEAFDVTGGLPT